MKRLLLLLALGIGGAYLFRTYAFEGIYVASDSMAPTLTTGTHLIVNKFAFFFRSPKRGEIVMFEIPQTPEKGLIKRVIAVEGDTLEIKDKEVYLNGKHLDEPYVQHTRANERLSDDNLPEIKVPPGTVYVLGDNRDVSHDSRDWISADGKSAPCLPLSNIQGLVLLP